MLLAFSCMMTILMVFSKSLFIMSMLILSLLFFSSFYIVSLLPNIWLLYILILVYAGGVMLLITYIMSISGSSEPLSINKKFIFQSLTYLTLAYMLLKVENYFFFTKKYMHISDFYASQNFESLLFIVMYLLFLLLVSLKTVLTNKGPLSM